MNQSEPAKASEMSRREFLQTAGTAAAGVSLGSGKLLDAASPARASIAQSTPDVRRATVRGAFIYPPTESLRKVGYYSWPGSTFDAEGRQKEYAAKIKQIERKLGMSIVMDDEPLDEAASVAQFINEVKQSKPDGLLLIPFKKGHWPHVTRIIEETGIPTVVLATLGILLVDHINQLHRESGVYLINSLDNLDAVEDGMRMIKTARWMKESTIISIAGSEPKETIVPGLGTKVRAIPLARFIDEFNQTNATDKVKDLAEAYRKNAKKVIQPTEADILDAAKTYFVLKRIIQTEKGDAVMMDCLPGLQKPHKHPPPCMGFMSLRDEGIAAGCQADLSATLTLMLVQELFDRPGFQQNASMETDRNNYFGAHCTSASKLSGTTGPSEPYILMNHAEAGWGCVPRVLWRTGQDVTMAQYLPGETPKMHIYSGQVVGCPPIPRTGGCRTNVQMTINEVDDVCDVKGMHQVIFYGNYAKQLRTFCQLYGIPIVT
jgi:L-fucose isomerase-like protein